MPYSQREQLALDAYLYFLRDKHATLDMVLDRLKVVRKLSDILTNSPHSRESYFQAVIKVTEKSNAYTRRALDAFMHEFYAFWIRDLDSIKLMTLYFFFDIQTKRSNLQLNDPNATLAQHPVLHTFNQQPSYLS